VEIHAERRNLKTLHLTNCWHPSSGGIGTFYKALFEEAAREGHFIRLVVPGPSTSIEDVGRFGRIYNIEAPRAPINPDYRMVLPHRYLFPRTALQRIINDESPDLIEVSDKYAMPYLAGLLRTRRLPGVRVRPTVVGLSHERMDENMAAYLTEKRSGQRFCEWYMKWLYFPMFDHHITVSEHTAAELIHASRGHRVRRGIWVAPMGVDCERFTPQRRSPEIRRRLLELVQGDADSTVLFYAGRLVPEKNLSLLIEMLARLDPATSRLAVAGSGILSESLQRECTQRGLRNVTFLGHIADRETLADYYANADIFVHPNPREPFGIAPLEAMSAGLALIAPNTGGVTSYANDSNAWLADPGPAAFADAVTAVRASPARRARRIAAARRTAERHRWSDVTARFLQLYRELNAVTQGEEFTATIAARTWSTPGNLFGREVVRL
jgi:alpha-1,6-mannosyltransferase